MISNDSLCISCYDNLKIAYYFKKKCVQSDILRRSQIIKIEKQTPEAKTPSPRQSPIKDETEIETLDEPIADEIPSDFECSECNEIFKDEILFTKHLDEMHSIETLDLIETVDDLEMDDDEQQSSSPSKKRKRGRTSKYPEDGKFTSKRVQQILNSFLFQIFLRL